LLLRQMFSRRRPKERRDQGPLYHSGMCK